MNKFALARKIASGVLSLNEAIKRHGKLLAFALLTVLGIATGMCQDPSPDATTIATAAQTAFNTVAPIIVSIATFFVVVRIAKRVVS